MYKHQSVLCVWFSAAKKHVHCQLTLFTSCYWQLHLWASARFNRFILRQCFGSTIEQPTKSFLHHPPHYAFLFVSYGSLFVICCHKLLEALSWIKRNVCHLFYCFFFGCAVAQQNTEYGCSLDNGSLPGYAGLSGVTWQLKLQFIFKTRCFPPVWERQWKCN